MFTWGVTKYIYCGISEISTVTQSGRIIFIKGVGMKTCSEISSEAANDSHGQVSHLQMPTKELCCQCVSLETPWITIASSCLLMLPALLVWCMPACARVSSVRTLVLNICLAAPHLCEAKHMQSCARLFAVDLQSLSLVSKSLLTKPTKQFCV